MSWDATLECEHGCEIADFNYTHNTNGMIAEALTDLGCVNAKELPSNHVIWKAIGPPWYQRLDGCTGAEGAAFLTALIDPLNREPEKYRAMNPPNGWGSFDSLVAVLTRMRDISLLERPTRWRASG